MSASTTQGQISYADANTVWTYALSGEGTGDFYQLWGRSLDSGHTWTTGSINIGSTDLGIGSIQAISAAKAYCIVFPLTLTAVGGGVYLTTDAGVTWIQQSGAFNSASSYPNLVYFFDTSNGIAQGDPLNGEFEIYTTIDGGSNWIPVPAANIPAPQIGEYGYSHGYEVVGNTLWFTTNHGRIFRSTDMGYSWTVAQSPIADFGAIVSGNFAMKDQLNGIFITSDWQFYRTSDGCMSWIQDFPTGIFRNFNVAYVPGTPNMYILTGEDLDTASIRGSSYSTDGGATWIDINQIDVQDVNDGGELEVYDANHALASGFSISSTLGGIWELIDNNLAAVDFQSARVFTASPNPTTGELSILGNNISQIGVYDILGKQVQNYRYSTINNTTIQLGPLHNGVYIIKVTNDAGSVSTIKIVKK